MKLLKKSLIILGALSFVFIATPAGAATVQEQIESIQKQILLLQQQLTALYSSPSYTNTTSNTSVFSPATTYTAPTTLTTPTTFSGAGTTGCLNIQSYLVRGSRGSEVTSLQTFLRAQGFFSEDSVGNFGPLTEEAVKRFQAAYGIQQTGTVGPETRAQISAVSCKYTAPTTNPQIPTPYPNPNTDPQIPTPYPNPSTTRFSVEIVSRSIEVGSTPINNGFSTSTLKANYLIRINALGGDIEMNLNANKPGFFASGINLQKDGAVTKNNAFLLVTATPPQGLEYNQSTGNYVLRKNNSVDIPLEILTEGRNRDGSPVDFGRYAISINSIVVFDSRKAVLFQTVDSLTSAVPFPTGQLTGNVPGTSAIYKVGIVAGPGPYPFGTGPYNSTIQSTAGAGQYLGWTSRNPDNSIKYTYGTDKPCVGSASPSDPKFNGSYVATGNVWVNPTVTTKYTITCGNAYDSATVVIPGTTTTNMPVDGGVTIDFSVPTFPTSPTTSGSPKVDLKANNSNGPFTLSANQNLSLAWVVSGATRCELSYGSAISGVYPSQAPFVFTPSDKHYPSTSGTTYTLTCWNSSNVSSKDSVKVYASQLTTTTPTNTNTGTNTGSSGSVKADIKANFSDGPLRIAMGTPINLSWTSTGATTCTLSGALNSGVLTSGQTTINEYASFTLYNPAYPRSTSATYNLSCTGSTGTATDSVTVTTVAPVVTGDPQPVVPPVPVIAAWASPTNCQGVRITWGAYSTTAASGFKIYRDGNVVATIGNSLQYEDIGLVAGKSYNYQVSAINGPMESGKSNTITATASGSCQSQQGTSVGLSSQPAQWDPRSPNNPPQVRASSTQCGGVVNVNWSLVSGASSYSVYKVGSRDVMSSDSPIFRTSGLEFTDSKNVPGFSVGYRVKAENQYGTSAFSPAASVAASPACPGTPAPSLNQFSVSPAKMKSGLRPTISWSVKDATMCIASGGARTDGWAGDPVSLWMFPMEASGSKTLNPVHTEGVGNHETHVAYTLSCAGPGGSSSFSIWLIVEPNTTTGNLLGDQISQLSSILEAFKSILGL